MQYKVHINGVITVNKRKNKILKRKLQILTGASVASLAVNTADEERLIGEIAARIDGSEKVDNQLEVKLTPTGRN